MLCHLGPDVLLGLLLLSPRREIKSRFFVDDRMRHFQQTKAVLGVLVNMCRIQYQTDTLGCVKVNTPAILMAVTNELQ